MRTWAHISLAKWGHFKFPQLKKWLISGCRLGFRFRDGLCLHTSSQMCVVSQVNRNMSVPNWAQWHSCVTSAFLNLIFTVWTCTSNWISNRADAKFVVQRRCFESPAGGSGRNSWLKRVCGASGEGRRVHVDMLDWNVWFQNANRLVSVMGPIGKRIKVSQIPDKKPELWVVSLQFYCYNLEIWRVSILGQKSERVPRSPSDLPLSPAQFVQWNDGWCRYLNWMLIMWCLLMFTRHSDYCEFSLELFNQQLSQ